MDRCGIVVDRCGSLWIVVGRCGSFRVLVTTSRRSKGPVENCDRFARRTIFI